MEYNHAAAVADGVNVDFDVYRLRTRITLQGATIEAGPEEVVVKRNRLTRAERLEGLDDDIVYSPEQLDRDVVAEDQIRTIFTHLRDNLQVIFPGRTHLPKTIVFAKDDSHAEDVTRIVREVFDKGNDFCQKITYRTGTVRIVTANAAGEEETTYRSSGLKPEDHLQAFRTGFNPRVAVTVDMIATGTDIKPVEMLVFLRTVRSLTLFEQMKGRGVRVVDCHTLRAVTPDARGKTHFVVVDCVGVCEQPKTQTVPIEKKRSASFKQLLEQVAFGARDEETLSSLASRLTRLEHQLDDEESRQVRAKSGGRTLLDLAGGLLDAFDPDLQIERARADAGLSADAEPTPGQVAAACATMADEAAAPIATSPDLRNTLLDLKARAEQIIDRTTLDEVVEAGNDKEARARAEALVTDFRAFIETHRDELVALQVLYNLPRGAKLRFDDVRALADALRTPHGLTPERLWHAYAILEGDRVRGAGRDRLLTDIVSLVRHALAQDPELIPFPDRVAERFNRWLGERHAAGRGFNDEQRRWLEMIRDHVAASCEMTMEDFDSAPFSQRGGLGRVWQVFGRELEAVVKELNEVLAA
jgi:type I restriction enzyme R subunit